MKKKILLALSSLLVLNAPLVFAEESKEVTELKSQIEVKEKELNELKAKLKELTGQESDGYTEWYEANGLKMKFSMSLADSYETDTSKFDAREGTYLIVKIKYKVDGEAATSIDSSDFNLYLAGVEYAGINLIGASLTKEAVPPGIELENQFFFDIPKHIAEAKDLTLKYEPRINSKTESLFELDVQKIIEQSKKVSKKDSPTKKDVVKHSPSSRTYISIEKEIFAKSERELTEYELMLKRCAEAGRSPQECNPQGDATPPPGWEPPQFSTYEEERMHYAENEVIVHEVDIAEGTDSNFFQLTPETVDQVQYVDEAE